MCCYFIFAMCRQQYFLTHCSSYPSECSFLQGCLSLLGGMLAHSVNRHPAPGTNISRESQSQGNLTASLQNLMEIYFDLLQGMLLKKKIICYILCNFFSSPHNWSCVKFIFADRLRTALQLCQMNSVVDTAAHHQGRTCSLGNWLGSARVRKYQAGRYQLCVKW